ncbi:MAG: ABC transporter ATP-binding protein [Anaerolineales bacterium]|nr:ABC transporter ATP-binding protein [Anaerolineales bacterium]
MQSVGKTYPMGDLTVHALRGLDLTIARGELVVLLGPSGSGKTTTLNILGGLDRPTGGRVVVEGEEIARFDERRLTAYRRTKVGFVFQFFNLIPTLTALENVEFALSLTGRGSSLIRRSRELLALVSLEDRADHFPSQLSGGEQQRVAIARALANRPALLLCDEPTGNLDVETARQVLQAIRDLNRREGATVILVSHNASIAPMADRVVRLHDGSVAKIESNPHPAPVGELAW